MEFERLKLQIGAEGLDLLSTKHIAVFGLGGVGGHVAETLTRSGIGELTIVDKDSIDITNINRQILALHSTIGQNKVDVCSSRLLDINPKIKVHPVNIEFSSTSDLDLSKFDYVVDAVDDIEAKVTIISRAKAQNIPVISAMGAGNKMDVSKIKIADIFDTNTCPLARIMRDKLKKLGISGVKCAFSTEQPLFKASGTISSNAFVPAVMGITIAREVVLDLLKNKE